MSTNPTDVFWTKMSDLRVELLGVGSGNPVPMASMPRDAEV